MSVDYLHMAAPAQPAPTPFATPQEHLRAWVDHIALLLRRYVAVHGRRMTDSVGDLESLHVSVVEAMTTTDPDPTPAILGWPDRLECQRAVDASLLHMARREALSEDAASLPLNTLAWAAGLSPVERAILAACVAPCVSTDVARLFAFAWSDLSQKRPTVGMLSDLVATERCEPAQGTWPHMAAFAEDAPLRRCGFITLRGHDAWGAETPLLHHEVVVAPRIVRFVLGLPAETKVGLEVRPADRAPDESEVVATPETVGALRRAVRKIARTVTHAPWVVLEGREGVGRRTLASALFAQVGLATVTCHLAELTESPPLRDAVIREALLSNAGIVVRIASSDSLESRAARDALRRLRASGRITVLTVETASPDVRAAAAPAVVVAFEAPADASAAWSSALQSVTSAELDGDASELSAAMAHCAGLTAGQIHEVVASAARQARFCEGRRVDLQALQREARQWVQHTMGPLARTLVSSVGWDDLVLNAETLAELRDVAAHVRFRNQVYDDWGFGGGVPYGRGVACLFSGPPGTGKTLAASVVANDLGYALVRIDLSRVVSKWVGETEKNLSRLFEHARRAPMVLLFDEADALFGKRTSGNSVQDRSANLEINHLLQSIEAFDGLCILTTNHEGNLDPAFKRRLRFKVGFKAPGLEQRADLWRRMLPRDAPIAGDVDPAELATVELTGAHIRTACLRAAFKAAQSGGHITQRTLEEAALIEARGLGMAVRSPSAHL